MATVTLTEFQVFGFLKPVIYYQVGELKMEHNGIRQAKSVIVNRNAYSSGRTLFVYDFWSLEARQGSQYAS